MERAGGLRFRLEAGQWWEIMLNIRPQVGGYDPMGGGTVWSQGGLGGQQEVSKSVRSVKLP